LDEIQRCQCQIDRQQTPTNQSWTSFCKAGEIQKSDDQFGNYYEQEAQNWLKEKQEVVD
jgi:hypothetical protein